jgi:hypothetical protein
MADTTPLHFSRSRTFLAPDAEVVARSKDLIARAKAILEEATTSTFLGTPRDRPPTDDE